MQGSEKSSLEIEEKTPPMNLSRKERDLKKRLPPGPLGGGAVPAAGELDLFRSNNFVCVVGTSRLTRLGRQQNCSGEEPEVSDCERLRILRGWR